MKHMKKFLSLLLTLAMVMAMGITAFAADGQGTITITNATDGNTYKIYKVFDATVSGDNIAYKLVSGKTDAPTGFTVDKAGNVNYTGKGENGQLTEDDIAALAEYVKSDDPVDTKTASGTTVTFSGLEYGYYYITTTTGTAITVTSTKPNANVQDKNEAPEVDKKITGVGDGSFDSDGQKALAQVGSTVNFESTITVKNGAENYVFHDTMSNGLSYNTDSLKVKVGTSEIQAGEETYNTTKAEGSNDTITINFNNDWIKTQVNNTITITYSATVTSDALTTNPAKNTAKITYGNNSSNSSTPSETKVYNATIKVTKVDDKNQALAGAGFVLKNSDGKYYKYDESTKKVTWVENIDDATELTTTTDKDGNIVKFTGLADGTYTLIEKTVPAGYNKAEDKNITINSGDYTSDNLIKLETVVNEAGAELPSTGGMGTRIFYTLGGIMVLGAAVLMITKRRMGSRD